MIELSTAAWEAFLADANASALLAVLNSTKGRADHFELEYPYQHRLCDVVLDGQAFRITRLVEPPLERERLFAERTTTPNLEAPGVPYWLHGRPLLDWVRDEAASPEKSEADWFRYLEPLPEVGTIVTGSVWSLAPFGIFVRLGADHFGLVRSPDLADAPPDGTAKLLKVGDCVRCRVLEVTPHSLGFRIALSMKGIPETSPR